MKRLFALLCTCAAFCDNALAYGEHLEPENSVFTARVWLYSGVYPESRQLEVLDSLETDAYHRMVISKLWEAYGLDTKARALVLPSFMPEYVVALNENKGVYEILYLSPEFQLWLYYSIAGYKIPTGPLSVEQIERWKKEVLETELALPLDYRDVKLERCKRRIEPRLGRHIRQLWTSMLLRTRYAEDRPNGRDGVTIHFSATSRAYPFGMAGMVWSPPEDSNTDRLTDITETMRRYCLTGDKKLLRQLDQQVKVLSARLRD